VYGPTQTYITPRLNELFKRAQEEAGRLKDEYISVEHLLLGVLDETSGVAVEVLRANGVNKDAVYAALQSMRGGAADHRPEP